MKQGILVLLALDLAACASAPAEQLQDLEGNAYIPRAADDVTVEADAQGHYRAEAVPVVAGARPELALVVDRTPSRAIDPFEMDPRPNRVDRANHGTETHVTSCDKPSSGAPHEHPDSSQAPSTPPDANPCAPQASSPAGCEFARTLRSGSSGYDVRRAQQLLRDFVPLTSSTTLANKLSDFLSANAVKSCDGIPYRALGELLALLLLEPVLVLLRCLQAALFFLAA